MNTLLRVLWLSLVEVYNEITTAYTLRVFVQWAIKGSFEQRELAYEALRLALCDQGAVFAGPRPYLLLQSADSRAGLVEVLANLCGDYRADQSATFNEMVVMDQYRHLEFMPRLGYSISSPMPHAGTASYYGSLTLSDVAVTRALRKAIANHRISTSNVKASLATKPM